MSPSSRRHFHWEFIAGADVPDGEKLHWPVLVTVIGYLSEADARMAAADIVQRERFYLQRVWECPACAYQEQIGEAMGDMVKAMKE